MVELCCPSATGWASSSDGVLWSVSVQTVLYGSALQYMSRGVVILFFHFRPQVLLQVVSRAVFKFNSFRGELTVLDSKTAQGQKRRTTPPHHHHEKKNKKHENLFSDQLPVYAAIGCLTRADQYKTCQNGSGQTITLFQSRWIQTWEF